MSGFFKRPSTGALTEKGQSNRIFYAQREPDLWAQHSDETGRTGMAKSEPLSPHSGLNFKLVNSYFFISIFLSVLVGLAACTSDDTWNDPILTSGTGETSHPETPTEKLQALDRAMQEHPKLARYVADVRAILLAQDLEYGQDPREALPYWKEALEKSRGAFGQAAFEGWVKAYVKSLGKKTNSTVLARLLLVETRGGEISPYMQSSNLTNEQNLSLKLGSIVPEWLEQVEPQGSKSIPAPLISGIPSSDPLLIKTANSTCTKKSLDRQSWSEWVQSLSDPAQTYWEALVEQCSGQTEAALSKFEKIYSKLVAQHKTQGLALEAITRVATIQRSLGRRREASDTYLTVVKTWNLPGVTPQSLGLDNYGLLKRRIDETLWASRYRALFGDHESAKNFAQESLNLINAAYTVSPNLSSHLKEQLADFKSEAYHSLAFRIAIQKKEYQSALSITLEALETPNISNEWKERLQWYAGLYEYLDGQYASSRKRWEILLTSVKDPSQRAMIYFWLARSTAIIDQAAESRFYLNSIVEEYPLSFYATVAPAVAGLKPDRPWNQSFGSRADLEKSLKMPKDFHLEGIRQDPEIGPLLKRAEILVKADVGPWAQIALDDLERSMGRTMSPESNPAPYVYLSRLYHRMGDHLKAISLTTRAAKNNSNFWKSWPDQILIYFPRPYKGFFTKSAAENQIETDLLYGIARQESGFTPNIKSSANALGVMQLIRPTAERFAPEFGISSAGLEQALKNPETNIRLGGRYLKDLSKSYSGFPPGIYGGYNAGELAVDLWIKLRANPDPLAFIELVPFGETKDYIKGVWRNIAVYHYIDQNAETK